MTKIDDRYWIETPLFPLLCTINQILPSEKTALLFRTFMHLIHKTHIIQVPHVLNSSHILQHFVANLNLSILHIIQIFLVPIKKVSIHTGQPEAWRLLKFGTPQNILNESISGKIVLDKK